MHQQTEGFNEDFLRSIGQSILDGSVTVDANTQGTKVEGGFCRAEKNEYSATYLHTLLTLFST